MRSLAPTARAASVSEKPVCQPAPAPSLRSARPPGSACAEVIGDHELGLRAARLDQQDSAQRARPSAGLRARTTLSARSRCAIAAPAVVKPAGVHEHARLVERHARIALAEHRRQPPRGGGMLAVEQRTLGEQESAGAGGTGRGAGARPALQRGDRVAHVGLGEARRERRRASWRRARAPARRRAAAPRPRISPAPSAPAPCARAVARRPA